MAERSVVVRLQANIADFKAQMKEAERSTKGVGDQSEKTSTQATTGLGRLTESAQKNRAAWDRAGATLTAFGAVAVGALGASIKAAIDWESAWTGVLKTVDGTDEQLAKVEGGLRDLARTLPSTHTEIAAVAEAAGQLGIQTENVVAFTKTMIDLGQSTNLSAEDAATAFARIANIMGTSQDKFSNMGSSVVELGNNFATTEREIVQMATRLASAARQIGLTEAQLFGIATALSSVGIEAEAGGTAFSRVMLTMRKAVDTASPQLKTFAETAGMTGAQFQKAFKDDAGGAITAFVQGLAAVEKQGESTQPILTDLGLTDIRVGNALRSSAAAADMFASAMDTSSVAFEENNALAEEAAKRYDTTASKLAMARNNIADAGIEIGEVFLPVLASLAETVAGVAKGFGDLPDPIQAVVGGFGAVAGVGALAAGSFLLLFPRVIETYKAFKTLSTTSPGVASGLGAIGKAAGIAGVVLATAAAIRGLVDSFKPAPATMEETTAALLAFNKAASGGGQADFSGLIEGAESFEQVARRLTDPSLMNRWNDFVSASTSWIPVIGGDSRGREERQKDVEQIERLGAALATMVQSGNGELAASIFDQLAAAWQRGGGSLADLNELMPDYATALQGANNEQEAGAQSAQKQALSVAELAQNAEEAYGSLENYAAALGMGEEATEDLIKRTQELGKSLADFVNPLGVYTDLLSKKRSAEEESARKAAESAGKGADSWRDFVRDTKLSFGEYLKALEEQVAAQGRWQENMLRLAGRVSQGTLEELARMGPEGAPLVADLVNRSDTELARFEDVMHARSKTATDAWGRQLTMATPVLAAIAATAGQGVVDELAAKLQAGTITVGQIAAQYGVDLAAGINPVLSALGRPLVNTANQRWTRGAGGLVMEADGGVLNAGGEDHIAQIAPAGAWRVWAEEETGGEAYIPLHPGKRTRSVDIWRETGKRLGVEFAEFAAGGFSFPEDAPRPRSTAPFQMPISTAADAAMQKQYDEVTAWLLEHQEQIHGGTPGSGVGVGGAWSSIFNFVKGRIPQARVNSAFRAGDPGYHGRGKAVDFGFGTGPGGAGSAGLASINRLLYDAMGANLAELIYTGAGDDRPDIKNGRNHVYSKPVQKQHRNHVHAAVYAKGGILNPHVRDTGGPLLPGFTFNGTGAPETVLPQHVVDSAAYRPATALPPGGAGDRPYIGQLVQNLHHAPTAGEIAAQVMHEVKVVSRGGKYAAGAR